MKQKLYNFLLKILRFFTRIYLWRTKPIVIGVTGTVGKTSCRIIIAQVLEQVQDQNAALLLSQERKSKGGLKIYTSPKNFNSELGLIFSIFCIESYTPSVKNLLKIMGKVMSESIFSRKKYDILVAEYGIDSPGDMDFLLSLMRPDIGIITRLDVVHSVNFPDGVESYWNDKIKLLLASKNKTFFNAKDTYVAEQEELFRNPKHLFETKIPSTLSYEEGDISQHFLYKKKKISMNLLGEENIHYTLCALSIAETLKIPLKASQYHFIFEQQAGRFSFYEQKGNILIDSSYNAGPESMKQVIENMKLFQSQIFPEKKLIFVLWDMREIGDMTQISHENLAKRVLDAKAIFTVWPEMYKYFVPKLSELWFSGELHSALSSREIGKKLKSFLKSHSEETYIILFKGSQNTIFTEEALAELLTPSQRKSLVRQSPDWMRKKEKFFRGL